jgi:hypothetical protein
MKKELICVDCFDQSEELSSFLNKREAKQTIDCIKCNGKIIIIDFHIKKIFIELRSKNYNPQYSCSGHKNEKHFIKPYIAIKEKIELKNSEFLKLSEFREGTLIKPNFDINSDKELFLFLDKLKLMVNNLEKIDTTDCKLSYYNSVKSVNNNNYNYNGEIHFIIGEQRALHYFTKKSIKKLSFNSNKVTTSILRTELKKSPTWINISDLGDLLFVLPSNNLIHDLFIVISLDQNYEVLGSEFIPESQDDILNTMDYYKARVFAKSIKSNFKIIIKDELCPLWKA